MAAEETVGTTFAPWARNPAKPSGLSIKGLCNFQRSMRSVLEGPLASSNRLALRLQALLTAVAEHLREGRHENRLGRLVLREREEVVDPEAL